MLNSEKYEFILIPSFTAIGVTVLLTLLPCVYCLYDFPASGKFDKVVSIIEHQLVLIDNI